MANTIFDETPYREFREYMGQLRSSTGRVLYDDIDLMKTYLVAKYVYIFDIEMDGDIPSFTFRFVGTHLCENIGFDPTGKNIKELDFGPGQEDWFESYHTVFKTERPHVISMVHYPDIPDMDHYRVDQPTCLLCLVYPTYNFDGKIVKLVGIATFIRDNHPEAGKFYEFTLDG